MIQIKWMPLLFLVFSRPISTSQGANPSSEFYYNLSREHKTEICLDTPVSIEVKEIEKLIPKKAVKQHIEIENGIYRKGIINETWQTYKRVNLKLVTHFSHALEECTYTGTCLITSAFSHSPCHSRKSLHKVGKAIDIDWRNGGEEFLMYLDSEEGIKWLEKHNIEFDLENIYSQKNHKRYRYNRKATGPHIHMYIKKKKNV